MQTSFLVASKHPMAEARAKDTGVTLIEVLIVLSLVAVSAGVVTLALPTASSQRSIAQEAELLAARLNLAAERSLIEGHTFKFYWDQETYGFLEWSNQEWHPLADPAFVEAEAAQSDVSLADHLGARRGQIIITPDLLPHDTGTLEIEISSGANRLSVLFDGLTARSKEVTP